jgi:hypothetical protein
VNDNHQIDMDAVVVVVGVMTTMAQPVAAVAENSYDNLWETNKAFPPFDKHNAYLSQGHYRMQMSDWL